MKNDPSASLESWQEIFQDTKVSQKQVNFLKYFSTILIA